MLDNMEESKTYESETESQAEIESDPEYNSDSYSRSSKGDYDFDSGDESPEHIKQLLMDEEIEISSDFEKEIYLFILSRSLSLNPEDDLNEVTYFDPKLERMVDIYEMIILLCQGIWLPSFLKFLSGVNISEYPNNIKLPESNKSYEIQQSCTAILSGDYEYFLKHPSHIPWCVRHEYKGEV